jgi:hypothetical protein
MKPHRFLNAIICAMSIIAASDRALAVEVYNSRIAPPAYSRHSLNLESGYKLPASSSLKSKPLSRVSSKAQYLKSQKTWTGLSGNTRRAKSDFSPYGAVRYPSLLDSYNNKSKYAKRPPGVKINANRAPYSLP